MNVHPNLERLVAYNAAVLDQALQVVAAYAQRPDADYSSHVGPHLRHVIEHYSAFMEQLPDRVIDYDARTLLGDIGGLKVWRVELTDSPPVAGAPAMATAAQRGPGPAPVDDVFGPWRISGASDDSWGTLITLESVPFGRPGGVDRISECSDRMPQWRTERDAIIKRVLDTPPTAEPASPGWPSSTG